MNSKQILLLEYIKFNPSCLEIFNTEYCPIFRERKIPDLEQIKFYLQENNKLHANKLMKSLKIEKEQLPIKKYKLYLDENTLLPEYRIIIQKLDKCNINEIKLYVNANVIGCPHSEDIDIVFLISNKQIIEDIKDNLAELDLSFIICQLEHLGYDISRGIDWNLVTKDERNDLGCTYKGSKESQNIISETYKYHKQMCKCIFPNNRIKLNLKINTNNYIYSNLEILNNNLDVNLISKIGDSVKFTLDWLQILIGDGAYEIVRPTKKILYKEPLDKRINFVIEQLQNMHFTNNMNIKKKGIVKSLTMKLIQIFLVDKDIYEYTKIELAKKINEFIPGSLNSALFLLLRGNMGIYNEIDINNFFKSLVSEYIKIITKNCLIWTDVELDMSNSTSLPDNIYNEFLLSPGHHTDKSKGKPTEKFKELFKTICPNRNISSLFILPSYGNLSLPTYVKNRAIMVDQRTLEWKELLQKYTCGKCTQVIDYKEDDWVEYYYNLIRGCIIEIIIIKNFDFTELFGTTFKKVSVGLLVENLGVDKSPGCAPDLLIVLYDEVIPVEIKCLISKPINNKSYRREVHLARSQILGTLKIIGKDTNKRGLLIFMYIYEKDGRVKYDTKYTFIYR